MSSYKNVVELVGNAGSDAEVRFFPSGDAVSSVGVATKETWVDKATGEPKERTEWTRVTFADRGNYKLGKLAGDLIKKGSKILVEGKKVTRVAEKDGVKTYYHEVQAESFQLIKNPANGFTSNKVALRGRLVEDPVVREVPGGRIMTTATILTNEYWRDRSTGEQREKTESHRLVFSDRGNFKLGKIAGDSLKKGSLITVDGALRSNEWQDGDTKRIDVQVQVAELMILSHPESKEENLPAVPDNMAPSAPTQAPSAPLASYGSWDTPNKDIPF